MSVAVAFEQVSKPFGDIRAADSVDLVIHDGEFFSTLGPSGSGKTTWLRLVTVQRFSDEDEAVAWANGVEYGLASSVWTTNFGRARRMAKLLDFGCVWINPHIPLVAEMPHGGYKRSGYGKDLSSYALELESRGMPGGL